MALPVNLGAHTQSLRNLPKNSSDRAPFPFEKAQAIPKANDFPLSRGFHVLHSGRAPIVNEPRTRSMFQELGLIAV